MAALFFISNVVLFENAPKIVIKKAKSVKIICPFSLQNGPCFKMLFFMALVCESTRQTMCVDRNIFSAWVTSYSLYVFPSATFPCISHPVKINYSTLLSKALQHLNSISLYSIQFPILLQISLSLSRQSMKQ